METENILPVICVALLLGAGIPAVLFAMKRGGVQGQIHLFRRAVQVARNPWKPESDSLDELAQRVEKLRDKDNEQP